MTTPTAESARPAPMSVSTRPDGRFITTGGFLAHHFKNHKPKLAFNPRFTPAEATAWRKQVRARLKKVLAFPRVPKQPAPKLISSDMRDGYTLQRWELYPEPFCVVPMLMLIPDTATAKKPAPGVLCLPGSDHPKEFLAGARNGFKLTYMPNYSDPAARTHDRLPVPEGIDANEFAKFHNFDDDHYFKDEVVVPWVCKALRARS